MKVKPLISLLLLLLLVAGLYGVNLPLYAAWQSRHSLYYDALQSGKELSWDQLYLAELGVKKARWENLELSFALTTEEFFDSARLQIKSIEIGYLHDASGLGVSAGSRGQGYGKNTFMQSYPILEKGYQCALYQNMRLNSLSIWKAWGEKHLVAVDLGGNLHNQATMIISQKSRLQSGANYLYEANLDLRAMDNHWRTPVAILSLALAGDKDKLHYDLQGALSHLPKYNATKEQQEYFCVAETGYRLYDSGKIALGASYQKRGYAPKKQSEYQLRYEQDFGFISLVPLVNLQDTKGSKLWHYRLLNTFKLKDLGDFSLYYDYSFMAKEKGRHSLGLAVDFAFAAF